MSKKFAIKTSKKPTSSTTETPVLFGKPWKLLVVGAAKTGKKSLVHRYVTTERLEDGGKTKQEHKLSVAISESEMINVIIWCQPSKKSLPSDSDSNNELLEGVDDKAMDGAHGVMLVFSTTDEKSMAAMGEFYEYVQTHLPDVPMVVVQNKIDQLEDSKVDMEEANAIARQHKVRLYRASAHENYNVAEAFTYLLQKCKKKFPDPEYSGTKPHNCDTPAVRRTGGVKPTFNRHSAKCSVM